MTDIERRKAAAKFAADWKGRGDEKQETQRFWLSLLQNVCGVTQPTEVIEFEKRVEVDNSDGTTTTKYIDGYLPATRILIEQKGAKIDLKKGERQSDGALLTPFQQGRRYGGYMPQPEQPRWIVVCNFQEFRIHNMRNPNDEPEILALSDLEKEYHRLDFLVDTGNEHIKKEMEISLQAGEIVGVLYDALLKQYKDPTAPETLGSLNALCVRLVFCLYAEDAGIFGRRGMFHDYLRDIPVSGIRKALVELFRILDQKPEQRDKYLADDNPTLAAFPYVNGGLFSDENIEIPPFTEELKTLLLEKASENFNWSEISPTIFGAVFESTLNPETRRSGGMHYTSIENIHKVIDPLFLDGLREELAEIKTISVERTRKVKLEAFQKKLAGLTFLDPACGSGNFLTETYISLRRLENETISLLHSGQIILNMDNPIQVSIGQFYGIEINDFAVTVAKTALWIAESQMMKETEDVVHMSLDFLPLKSYANITEDNALRVDWESVIPKHELNYIMGNPPFLGYTQQTPIQKSDLEPLYGKVKNIDYVAGWYMKATQYIQTTSIRVAFVSTNSITQGEQVTPIWEKLFNEYGIHIDFAYRTFRWDSEATIKAHVHCVIIGFSVAPNNTEKRIFFGDGVCTIATNINGYLLNGPNVFIMDRKTPLCKGVSTMNKGSQGTDEGLFYFTPEEYEKLIAKYPDISEYLREATNGKTFISNTKRYCLWCKNKNPAMLKKYPELMDRVQKVQELRRTSPKAATRKWADLPYLFTEDRQPESGNYLLVPLTSGERRRYVPIGYLSCQIIANNSVQMIPNATLYEFGILTSNVFMAWMRAVCGRLKSDYRITVTNVYNNFPWPTPTDAQKAKIEQTVQAILDARALYPDSSLADLYDETTMPPELRKAHQQNDRAVMQAYGFSVKNMTESKCVAELMRIYQELAKVK